MQRIILFFIIFLFTFSKVDNLLSLNNSKNEKISINIKKIGKIYCVLIALDQYKNRLPIVNHKEDAVNLKNILYNNYEIDEFIELYDYEATKEKIESLFLRLQNDLKKDDSLILYYSGHGYIDIKENETYWLPYDAGINEYLKEFWISNNDVNNFLKKINANQILIICDSNFNKDYIKPIYLDDSIKFTNEYFENAYSKKSRIFLGSDVSETGILKSEFSTLLNSTLNKMKDEYIDIINVYNEIKSKMKGSIPIFGEIKNLNHEQGASFVLFTRKEKPLKIEKEEISKKEEEKEKPIVYQKKINLNIVNKTGTALMPIGATIATAGISLFIVDILIFFPMVRERMYNGTTYTDYEYYYNLNLAIFSSSIATTVIGLGLTAVGIGLKVYAVRQKKVTFNLEYNNSIKAYFAFKF